ncbi:hypothetical protein BH11ACT4_BH11ACT4_18240 [soil metagenome]
MPFPGPITAITLFAEDLPPTKAFYDRVFAIPAHYEDDASCVFIFGGTMINLLKIEEAPDLIAPAKPSTPQGFQFTLTVDDVDDMCAELQGRGVELLNGPTDRPWGIRTASFQDPTGAIWEIAR